MPTFQEVLLILQNFWTRQGCLLQQSFDTEVGAGTFNPESLLRCLGPEPYRVCHVEVCRRPADGRYGLNPNRLQQFHQFQVILKPSIEEAQQLYIASLSAIGLDVKKHDIRWIHDDWKSPTLGAWGLGWEVWCDGMEITQFTYFQSINEKPLHPIAVEITYGIERICLFQQKKKNVFDISFNQTLTYGDVFFQNEKEWSCYNFEEASPLFWKDLFEKELAESKRLVEKQLPIPAYTFAVKASHAFNMLEAMGAISTTARVDLIQKIRSLVCLCTSLYINKKNTSPSSPPNPSSPKTPLPSPVISKKRADVLLEIGSEELPPSFIPKALSYLEKTLFLFLKQKQLSFEKIETYGTPRRLAIFIKQLDSSTQEETLKKKGPSLSTAFDATGSPSLQGEKFFQSLRLPPCSLKQIQENQSEPFAIEKDTHLVAFIKTPKEETLTLLAKFLPHLIEQIPFEKKMRWAHFNTTYARPIRWLVALFGSQIIPFSVANISTTNITYGHRQIKPKPIKLRHAKKYVKKLRRKYVLVSPKERRAHIEKQLNKLEKKFSCKALFREKLISQTLYVTEYPTLKIYPFDKTFLSLPKELLSSEMANRQYYFPLQNSQKELISRFIVAIDTHVRDSILENNQSVLVARLTDAAFLFEQDKKRPFDATPLKGILFHQKLGTMYDKTKRIEALTTSLANRLKKRPPLRAAQLCKCDLTSLTVSEFPELQGVMGRYYAIYQKEPNDVALAIEEHWLPNSEKGEIPTSEGGAIVAMADKIDTLSSCYSIGLQATSSKDPYALKRCAIGVLRILIEKKWFLDLSGLGISEKAMLFLQKRLDKMLKEHFPLKEQVTIPLTVINPYDAYLRMQALYLFQQQKPLLFEKLLALYKRTNRVAENKKNPSFNYVLLKEEGEKLLYQKVLEVTTSIDKAIFEKNYEKALQELLQLEAPLAHFFSTVRILIDLESLKENRLALLQKVLSLIHKLIHFIE